jgi:hypothetical protein
VLKELHTTVAAGSAGSVVGSKFQSTACPVTSMGHVVDVPTTSCKTLPYSSALLEASFCHETPGLHDHDLQSVLAKLTTYVEQTEAPYSVGPRLETDDQSQLLSSYGRTILMIALKPMVGCTGELLWADNVVATSTLPMKFAEETSYSYYERVRS